MTQIFTIDQLCISPLNVRLHSEDAEHTTALEANIAANGLMYPLFVHDMTPYRDMAMAGEPVAAWGVLAGGRRLRAIRRLIAAGKLPADFEIEGIVRDLAPAAITELSLAENLLRRNLHPYEIQAAIARSAEQGSDVAQIAEHIGQTPEWVRRQFRLGRLVPEIFDAYVQGTIAEEQAQAFAATEDQDLQRAAWTHFGSLDHWARDPGKIRAWYKVGDRELERLLRFVGADVYRAASGRFELDLFADGPERGRVVDQALLREQVETKMTEIRQDLRRRTGRTDLRFASTPPQFMGQTDPSLAIDLQDAGGALTLPGEDIVVTVDIELSGEFQVHYWWASRKAKRDASRESAAPAESSVTVAGHKVTGADGFDRHSGYAQAARAAVKDEHGLTADGLQVMRSLRREILRGLFLVDALEDGTIGRDYLVWSQLRQELGKENSRSADTGSLGLASHWQSRDDAEPIDLVEPHLEEAGAHRLWEATLDTVREQPFITIANPGEAFEAYHFANDRVKNTAAAVLAGMALLRSANVPGWRIATHDHIAQIMGASDQVIRELWRPTSRLMALFPKMKRLELAQSLVDPEAFRDWHKLPDSTLSGAVAGAVEQDPGWVHPLLSFGVASERSAEQREAAE